MSTMDSLFAHRVHRTIVLIVTGRTRQHALERARRALDELVIEGMPTVTPFHRAVVADPAFADRSRQRDGARQPEPVRQPGFRSSVREPDQREPGPKHGRGARSPLHP